jgi:lysophospholipase L1-like esterase
MDFTAANGDRFLVSINSRGFRTPEFAVPKPPGVLRIACVGASTTVQGRRDDETYPARLEAALRRRYPGVPLEVLNLGVSGTRSGYWLARLDRLDSFDPDVVVQYNGANDIVQRYFADFESEHPLKSALYARSRLVNLSVPLARRDFAASFESTLANVGALSRHVRARGGTYVGATFAGPDYGAAGPEMRRYLDHATAVWSGGRVLSYRQYQGLLEGLNERLRAAAAREGAPLADVAAAITSPELFTDLCHLQPAGLEAMVETFLPVVGSEVERRAAPSTS